MLNGSPLEERWERLQLPPPIIDLRRLPPGDALGHSSQNHFFHFRPLHQQLSVSPQAPPWAESFTPGCSSSKWTFHVLIRADISTCYRHIVLLHLTKLSS